MIHIYTRRIYSVLPLILVVAGTNTSSAQKKVTVSGLAYADYSYTVQSDDDTADGENAFGYRRVYLTTDYSMSDRFSGRVRFETSDRSTDNSGRPSPFIKDMWVKWTNALGQGHEIVFGVSNTPIWVVSEKAWGYRSLQKTVLDRGKAASSRDMGVVFRGPIDTAGKFRYGFMFGNNSGVSRETDKYKRIYGQIEYYPSSNIQMTVGGDYASFSDGSSYNLNGFLGGVFGSVRLGAEGFYTPRTIDSKPTDDTRSGGSFFVRTRISATTEAIFRIDRLEKTISGLSSDETFWIAGYAISPEKNVQIIPNIMYLKNSLRPDARITGRLTLYIKFK